MLLPAPRCRWSDDYPDTWEPEEHVSPDLVALFEAQQALFDGSSSGGGGGCSSAGGHAVGSSEGGNASGSSSSSSSGSAAAATGSKQLQESAA